MAVFNAQTTFGAVGAYSVAVADVNGDGFLDIVTVNYGAVSTDACCLLGNGNGTFQAQKTVDCGLYARDVHIADVNGDGKPDLVVTNYIITNGTVSVLLGNGNGTFQARTTTASGGSFAFNSVVADFDGDGKLDIAVTNYASNNVGILIGNGDGTFKAAVTYATGTAPTYIACGDIDNDGKIDLVVSNKTGPTASILLGNGNGTFKAQTTIALAAISAQLTPITLADVNRDGKLDLLSANGGTSSLAVYLGNGNGTFAIPTTFATQTAPKGIAVADVNGDNYLDVMIIRSARLVVLLGNGDGTFQAQQTQAAATSAQGIALGDVDGDGRPDVVVGQATGTIGVFTNPNLFSKASNFVGM